MVQIWDTRYMADVAAQPPVDGAPGGFEALADRRGCVALCAEFLCCLGVCVRACFQGFYGGGRTERARCALGWGVGQSAAPADL